MTGAHEIVMILRAQNYASSAIRRVGGDLARLEKQRNLQARSAQMNLRVAQQELRLSQLDAQTGSKGIAIQNARLRLENRIETVEARKIALMDKNIGIERTRAGIKLQELKLDNQILAVEERQTAAIKAQQALLEKNKATQASMAVGVKGQRSSMGTFLPATPGLARQAADLAAHRAETARILADRRLTAAKAAGADTRIPERRLREAEMAKAIASGKIKEMDIVLKQLQKTEQEEIATLSRLSGQANQYGRRISELNAQIKMLTFGEQALNAQERALIATSEGYNRTLAEMQGEVTRLTALEQERTVAVKNQQAVLAAAQEQAALMNTTMAGQGAGKFEEGARAVTSFGRAAQMTGLISTAAFGMAANSAAELNASTTLAATQFGNNSKSMVHFANEIQGAVTDMMQSSTSDAQGISDAFYQVFSGIDEQLAPTEKNFQRVNEFVRKMSDAAMAGHVDIQDATESTIRVMNNFNIPLENVDKLLNQQAVAVRYGMVTWKEYSDSLSQVIPAGLAAGQSLDDINAALAQTTRELGVSFSRAGIARLFEFLQRPEFQAGMHRLGVDVTDATGKLLPLNEVITKIAKTDLGKSMMKGAKGAQQFAREITKVGGAPAGQGSTIQTGRVLTVLVKNQAEYNKLQQRMIDNTGQFSESVKASLQSSGVQWKIFMNRVHAVVLEVGQAAIPAFTAFGSALKVILDYMQNHPGVVKAIGYFGALASIITLVLGSLIALGGSIAIAYVSIGKLGKFISGGGVSWKALTLRLGLYGAAILLIIKYHEQFSKALGGSTNAIKTLVTILGALSVAKVISSLATIGITAETSATKVNLLRSALGKIALLGAIIVPIIINISKQGRSEFEKAVAERMKLTGEKGGLEFKKGILGSIQGLGFDMKVWTNEHLRGMDAVQARAKALQDLMEPVQEGGKMEPGAGMRFVPDLAKQKEAIASLKNFTSANEAFTESAKGAAQAAQREFERTGKYPAPPPALFTDKQFLVALQNVAKLKKAAEQEPNLGKAVGAWRAYNSAVKTMDSRMTASQAAIKEQLMGNLKDVAALSDQTFSKQYKNAQRLFQVATASNAIGDWKKYYTAVEDLSSAASQTQMAWAAKVFGQIEKQATLTDAQAASKTSQLAGLKRQFDIGPPTMQGAEAITKLQKQLEALTPAQQMFFDKINENMKFLSDQAAVKAFAQVTKLKEAFDKAPSLSNWQAWFDANKVFTQQFTQDQQQAAQDIEAAHKAATEKIKQDYDSLLDKVRSTFNEIRSANATAFGTLGSGPVTQGLSNRVGQIRDAANAQSDAIRNSGEKRAKALNDQADRIQEAFDNSVSKIDARTGDLIDWGLMANPEVQRRSVEAQVKSLHQQAERIKDASDAAADKIQKNATARADKLAKRLSEHRLTGKEILGDLQAQVKAFTNWNNDLNAIAKRGGPAALIDQLRALGPEFDPMLKGIRGMSPAMFAKYIATFNKGQKEIDKASLAATANRLKKEYPLYLQQGKNISDWLAQGVQENPALKNAFIKIMRSVFGNKAGPPPTKPAQKRGAGARTPQNASHVTHNNTYNYNAGKGMDYSTWMKKNHFRQRNHRKC
jgi:TP901 family phage tail tape measure protein